MGETELDWILDYRKPKDDFTWCHHTPIVLRYTFSPELWCRIYDGVEESRELDSPTSECSPRYVALGYYCTSNSAPIDADSDYDDRPFK